jgi:hypothetical protein
MLSLDAQPALPQVLLDDGPRVDEPGRVDEHAVVAFLPANLVVEAPNRVLLRPESPILSVLGARVEYDGEVLEQHRDAVLEAVSEPAIDRGEAGRDRLLDRGAVAMSERSFQEPRIGPVDFGVAHVPEWCLRHGAAKDLLGPRIHVSAPADVVCPFARLRGTVHVVQPTGVFMSVWICACVSARL